MCMKPKDIADWVGMGKIVRRAGVGASNQAADMDRLLGCLRTFRQIEKIASMQASEPRGGIAALGGLACRWRPPRRPRHNGA